MTTATWQLHAPNTKPGGRSLRKALLRCGVLVCPVMTSLSPSPPPVIASYPMWDEPLMDGKAGGSHDGNSNQVSSKIDGFALAAAIVHLYQSLCDWRPEHYTDRWKWLELLTKRANAEFVLNSLAVWSNSI